MSRGSGAKVVLTNPVDGKDLYLSVPSPAVNDITGLKAGYMCEKAVFVAKTTLRNYTMSLYTCDAKTGEGTRAITPDNLFVYAEINVSPTEPRVVFPGKSNDNPEYQSIYTINEDGSGLAHLSEPLESVTGMDGREYELQPTSFPVFSPDGSKIAFDALVLTLPDHNDYYEFILTMNADGSNKTTVYSEPGQHIDIYDLCWTQDGNFLLFVMMKQDDNFHRHVKALNLSSGKITEITAPLEVNGDQVYHISTSPNSNRLVFNQHLGGGSDLFIAEYEIHDDVLTIKGTPVKITDKTATGYSYYTPSWQHWDEMN
jgi:Tol biopolymer transport system component